MGKAPVVVFLCLLTSQDRPFFKAPVNSSYANAEDAHQDTADEQAEP
jgi:hypothetical protein